MGENIQATIAKAFKHYGNAAYQRRFMAPDLFSRTPFVCYHTYRCRATNGCFLQPGDNVVVVLRNHKIEIWLQSHAVGEVEGEDAAELVQALEAKDHAEQWMMARIDEECGLDRHFFIKLEGGPIVVEAAPMR